MEAVAGVMCPYLEMHPEIYLHCLDEDTVLSYTSSDLKAIRCLYVFGHFSVLENLEEIRFLLFLATEEVAALRDLPSPVVLQVTSSCLLKVCQCY